MWLLYILYFKYTVLCEIMQKQSHLCIVSHSRLTKQDNNGMTCDKADNFPMWFLAGLYASLITGSTELVQVSYIFYYCYLVLELSYLTLYIHVTKSRTLVLVRVCKYNRSLALQIK